MHKALGTSEWQKAQQIVRAWEAECGLSVETKPEPISVTQAWSRFLLDLEARKLQTSTIRKYRLLQRQMTEFAAQDGIVFLKQFDLGRLDLFRSGWNDGPLSATKKLERLRAFFRFAHKRKWIEENSTPELKAPKVSLRPTMPFTAAETQRTLSAIDQYLEKTSESGRENGRLLRALVLLLRYSGLRIGDAINLTYERLVGNRLFLYMQKTGIPVYTVLPDFVVRALEASPRRTPKYFFWGGAGKLDSAVRSWQTRLRRLFKLANVPDGHAHRFRDTFAIELLLAGIPIERVSVLLGHQSVKVTEKHYNPWVRSRQEQLEADVARTWSNDPIVKREKDVTQRVVNIRQPLASNRFTNRGGA